MLKLSVEFCFAFGAFSQAMCLVLDKPIKTVPLTLSNLLFLSRRVLKVYEALFKLAQSFILSIVNGFIVG